MSAATTIPPARSYVTIKVDPDPGFELASTR